MTRERGRHLACSLWPARASTGGRPTLVQPTLTLMGESIPLR
jgi:hypothetical protein